MKIMSSEIERSQLETLMRCKKGDKTDLKKYIANIRDLAIEIRERNDFIFLYKINKALSDKNRLVMFNLILEKGEMCICEFSIALNLSQPTISHHLRKLENSELIKGEKSGDFIHFKIVKSNLKRYLELINKYNKV
jgi:DNA-binding transcriptional ArsR family regulator